MARNADGKQREGGGGIITRERNEGTDGELGKRGEERELRCD